MKKIIAFGGSNSRRSINKMLASYAANLINGVEVITIDLNDFEMPIYSIDREEETGIPEAAVSFRKIITEATGVVISLAEHNGSYAVAFKNIYDWVSRIDGKVWQNKPMLLMATSPGGRGGQTVLQTAKATFTRMGAQLVADFSLPSFQENFQNNTITDPVLSDALKVKVKQFEAVI